MASFIIKFLDLIKNTPISKFNDIGKYSDFAKGLDDMQLKITEKIDFDPTTNKLEIDGKPFEMKIDGKNIDDIGDFAKKLDEKITDIAKSSDETVK